MTFEEEKKITAILLLKQIRESLEQGDIEKAYSLSGILDNININI